MGVIIVSSKNHITVFACSRLDQDKGEAERMSHGMEFLESGSPIVTPRRQVCEMQAGSLKVLANVT